MTQVKFLNFLSKELLEIIIEKRMQKVLITLLIQGVEMENNERLLIVG